MSIHESALLLAALAITLGGCASGPKGAPTAAKAAAGADDAKLADLSTRWLDGMLKLGPIGATSIGEHRYDSEIDDLSQAGRDAKLAFAERMLAELEAIDVTRLGREAQVDASILRTRLKRDIWEARVQQDYRWNPLMYNALAGSAIYDVVAREFAPAPQRLASVTARLEKLPTLLAQARANLELARVPKVHAETVIKQNKGLTSVIDELVLPMAKDLPDADRQRLDAAIAGYRKAVAEHQAWLEGTLLPAAKGDVALGRDLYDQKLALVLGSSLSRDEIKARAEAEIARVRGEMYDVARKVLASRAGAPALPDKPDEAQQQKAIEAALELAYADRPARDAVVDTAKQALAEATAFTRSANLVTVPSDPVKIIIMPEFQRGVALAYCDSPGPLDKGLDTYYAISPIPSDWTQEQVDSFLREYNTRQIHVLTIHEAMPGHYLEGAHSVAHPWCCGRSSARVPSPRAGRSTPRT